MESFKQCPVAECAARNLAAALRCVVCGTSLRTVAVKYAVADASSGADAVSSPPEGAHQSAMNPGGMAETGALPRCTCKSPNPAERVCSACGGLIDAAALAVSESRCEPREQLAREGCPKLRIAGIADIGIGNGVLLGRDALAVQPELARALAGFRGVSARHAWFGVTSRGVIVLDMGSRNGTWLKGQRLIPFAAHNVVWVDLPCTVWLGGKLPVRIARELET